MTALSVLGLGWPPRQFRSDLIAFVFRFRGWRLARGFIPRLAGLVAPLVRPGLASVSVDPVPFRFGRIFAQPFLANATLLDIDEPVPLVVAREAGMAVAYQPPLRAAQLVGDPGRFYGRRQPWKRSLDADLQRSSVAL